MAKKPTLLEMMHESMRDSPLYRHEQIINAAWDYIRNASSSMTDIDLYMFMRDSIAKAAEPLDRMIAGSENIVDDIAKSEYHLLDMDLAYKKARIEEYIKEKNPLLR